MQALVKTPELFRAGATFAGVTDLPKLLARDQAYLFIEGFTERAIGERWSDADYLASVSPARNAARIRAPVFVAHGTEDSPGLANF